MKTKLIRPLIYIIVGCLSISILILLTKYDYSWTMQFIKARDDAFIDLVENTIFKGQFIGFRDIATFTLILTGIGYIASFSSKHETQLKKYRPYFSFILISGFSCMLFTHSVKMGMSRPRPKDVISGKCEFVNWYSFGPKLFSTSYKRSMPSGHTSMTAILLVLGYVLVSLARSSWSKGSGVLLFLIALLMSIMMGMARSMHAHWVADTFVSILGCLIIIDFLYWLIVKNYNMPLNNIEYLIKDLKICLMAVQFFIGVLLMLIGIHALMLPYSYMNLFGLVLLPALAFILISIYQTVMLIRQN